VAQIEDFTPWLNLAAEVEHLFGSLVNDPLFQCALHKNIKRGTAFCIRENNGPPGVPLVGGLLFSPQRLQIGWLAVAQKYRRSGAGQLLVEKAFSLVNPPAEVMVITFVAGDEGGLPARRFYEKLGFYPAEIVAGPGGVPRQVYRCLT
jgi:ribosomal protein S18 acetylase RimI-like enzyme